MKIHWNNLQKPEIAFRKLTMSQVDPREDFRHDATGADRASFLGVAVLILGHLSIFHSEWLFAGNRLTVDV